MLSISTPEHAAALKEARENAVRKLIAKGFTPELVYGSIERKDEKTLRRMLKKLTRKELRNLFKEE